MTFQGIKKEAIRFQLQKRTVQCSLTAPAKRACIENEKTMKNPEWSGSQEWSSSSIEKTRVRADSAWSRNFWKRARLNYSYGTGCTTHGGRVTPRRCSDRSRTRFDQFGACCPPTFTFVRVQRVLWPIYARITGPRNACELRSHNQSQNRSRPPDLVAWHERGPVSVDRSLWDLRFESLRPSVRV